MCPPIRWRSRDQSFARRGAATIGLESQCLSRVKVSGKIIPHKLHYLLEFCHVVDSVATLTTDVSVFGPLSVGDKSLGMENRHENQGRDSIKVGSPHETLCISILDFRRRSIITSGSRVSTDCQYEWTTLLLSKVYSQRHGQVPRSSPNHRHE
jgi:hypothetical protein